MQKRERKGGKSGGVQASYRKVVGVGKEWAGRGGERQ